jgi:ABC-type long-subunit fatty acid transport system fused permease/ATPase subunit
MLPILIIFTFTASFLASLFNANESLVMAGIIASILGIVQIMVKSLHKPKKYRAMASSITID